MRTTMIHHVESVRLKKTCPSNNNTHTIEITVKDFHGNLHNEEITFFGDGASDVGGIEKHAEFKEH